MTKEINIQDFSVPKIEKYRNALAELKSKPPKQKIPKTARQIVQYLSVDIQRLLDKGFTVDDISKALAGAADGISAATFKNHVRRFKAQLNDSNINQEDGDDDPSLLKI